MTAEKPRTVGDAPDLFVGVGPAAEVLGIPHVRLHAAIREGRLLTYAARRDGRMVRLLRLGDLVLLDPELADRPLPDSLVDAPADPSPDPTPRTEWKGADGLAAEASGAAASPPSVRARGARRGRSDGPAGDESRRYLWGELERVRQQVRESREQQESVVQDLLRSGEEARQLFARLSLDEEARRGAQAELARERAEIDRALADLDRMRRFTFASVTVVVLLAAAAIGYVARGAPATSRAAEPTVGRGTDDERGAALASSVPVTPQAPPELAPPELAHPEPEIAEQAIAGLAPASREPRVAEAAASVQPAPVPPAEEDTKAGETPQLEGNPDERLAAEEPARADERENLRVLPGPPPAAVLPGDRACELFSVTRPNMPLREVLGPCWGRWNPDLAATVGSSRSGGEAYCRQHAFYERALGASLVRAEQEADLARRAGLVPPLLRMRVETAASAALAAHVPSWLESGFEAGSVEGHRVEAGGGPGESWVVDSWVRYVDFAANERRRTFRVEVLLGDGPEPDRERSFAWTDDDSPTDEDRTTR